MKLDKLNKKRLRRNVLEELEKRGEFKPRKVKVIKNKKKIKKTVKEKVRKKRRKIKMIKPLIRLPLKASKSKPTKRKSSLIMVFIVLVSIIILIGVAIGVDILAIYKINLRDPFSLEVSKIFQLPAGEVNGQKIMLADYIVSNNTLKNIVAVEKEGAENIWTGANYEEKIFNTLAVEKLIDHDLENYGINKANIMVDKELTDLIHQSGSLEGLKTKIKAIYGIKLSDFLDYIVRPIKKRQLLTRAVLDSNSNSLKNKADDILDKIKLGEINFKDAAKEYSDDEAGINTAGDMGWFVKGELPEELEQKLFDLGDNELYPEVVKDDRGYHIFKVDSKLYNFEDGSESIRLSHIFFKFNLNEYIKNMFDSAKIVKYIK